MDMSGKIAALVVVGMLVGVGSAAAQETTPGPGTVEVTYMPAGAGYFMSKGNSPSFGNYGFGTAGTYNINRFIGIEGELAAMIATSSGLQFGDLDTNIKSPNVLSYTGNVVVSPFHGRGFYPYAAGGVGGLTMFVRPQLGINDDETFLSGNVGGGVKWYAPNNRWGLRGDYRFVATKGKDDAPAFFGRETQYVHRVYGGFIINTGR
jgi:outer membrane protein with beta-barrel domain